MIKWKRYVKNNGWYIWWKLNKVDWDLLVWCNIWEVVFFIVCCFVVCWFVLIGFIVKCWLWIIVNNICLMEDCWFVGIDVVYWVYVVNIWLYYGDFIWIIFG